MDTYSYLDIVYIDILYMYSHIFEYLSILVPISIALTNFTSPIIAIVATIH